MWISKRTIESNASDLALCGDVTIGESNRLEVSGESVYRKAQSYTPYGYNCSVPKGEKVLMIKTDVSAAVAGTVNDTSGIDDGEVMLSSAGGASILLKNDGSVIINGNKYSPRQDEQED